MTPVGMTTFGSMTMPKAISTIKGDAGLDIIGQINSTFTQDGSGTVGAPMTNQAKAECLALYDGINTSQGEQNLNPLQKLWNGLVNRGVQNALST